MTQMDLKQLLQDRFKLDDFRAGQRDIIEAIISGKDALAVMPTGGGKSLCFQTPAIAIKGRRLSMMFSGNGFDHEILAPTSHLGAFVRTKTWFMSLLVHGCYLFAFNSAIS